MMVKKREDRLKQLRKVLKYGSSMTINPKRAKRVKKNQIRLTPRNKNGVLTKLKSIARKLKTNQRKASRVNQ